MYRGSRCEAERGRDVYVFERIGRLYVAMLVFEVLAITEGLRHVLMLVIDVQCFNGTTHLALFSIGSSVGSQNMFSQKQAMGAVEACKRGLVQLGMQM
jgi:hypothetical protein